MVEVNVHDVVARTATRNGGEPEVVGETRRRRETAVVEESAFERDDVEAILQALFDIRGLLARLVDFFEDGDEGEEETNS